MKLPDPSEHSWVKLLLIQHVSRVPEEGIGRGTTRRVIWSETNLGHQTLNFKMATKMHLLTRLSQSFTRLPATSGRISVSRGLARTYSTPSNSETPASKEEPKKEDEKESSGPPPIAILIAGGLGIYLGFALSNSGKKDKINAEARSSGTIKVPESADYADIGGKKGEEIEKEYGKEVKDKQAVYIGLCLESKSLDDLQSDILSFPTTTITYFSRKDYQPANPD